VAIRSALGMLANSYENVAMAMVKHFNIPFGRWLVILGPSTSILRPLQPRESGKLAWQLPAMAFFRF